MRKKIISIDFDGVINSYKSGWKGIDNIPDPPVKDSIKNLKEYADIFEVNIFSSRSEKEVGREAMKKYIKQAILFEVFNIPWEDAIESNLDEYKFSDEYANFINKLKFPENKPAAIVGLDDRVITFKGKWPTIDDLNNFKSWYEE